MSDQLRRVRERKEIIEYLVGEGWERSAAEAVAAHPNSLAYASARFNMACRELGRAVYKAMARWRA
jgi:hypothetical protein